MEREISARGPCSPALHEGRTKAVLTAMELLLGLVFAGWLMFWAVIPTNTYWNSWYPAIRDETNSTYLGSRQGGNILIFTFPILFIATLGCVYLHLITKRSNHINQSSRFQAWRKRPVLVKGPMGILSLTELAFSLMFLALLIWSFSVYLTTSFARINPKSLEREGEKLWEAKMWSAALRLGLVGNICLAFLFFPVTRGTSLMPLVGLTSEASIKYHVWLGHTVMVLFTAHGLCYIILWAATNELSEMLKWENADVSNVAGELSLLFGLVLWGMTYPRIRRKTFELFFYSHQLYILFLFFFLLHLGFSFFCTVLPGIYLFMIDRYLRFLQSRQRVRLLSARLLPSQTVELNFSKSLGFSYTPLSVVFINVPSISALQWHPYTVCSSSSLEPERLSIIIKKEGSWTQKLYQSLSLPSLERLEVSLEGPYSPASVDYLRYESLVMVSGGSGIAPFISIIRELIHQSAKLQRPTPSILLICSFKTAADLTMLDLLLPVDAGNISYDLSGLELSVEAFVTREKAPSSDADHKLIRSVWLKPIPSDVPVSPVLGPNGWLWLGAIISSSFVAFLVILGIVTRYYIYPIDKNTNQIYSYSAKALLSLLLICVCIASTSSTAVLWNKRRVDNMEAKKVQIMAPNTDRELESLPFESLVQATKVHYGGRPDLKKMLLECRDSNTGVMASGPRGMRHEVAAICSSGLANYLHFESISFSW